MAKQEKYLLTVDSETGQPVKIERMGEAGELTEVPLESLQVGQGAPSSPQVVNVFIGAQPSAGAEAQGPPKPPAPPMIIIGGPRPPKPPKPGDEDDED